MNLASLARAGTLCMAGWLAGCNSTTLDSYQSMKLAIAGPPPVASVEQVRALDRPALLARLGQSEALLVLGSRSGSIDEWHGLSQALVIRNGRLVQTAGLPDQSDFIAPLVANDPFLNDLRTIEDGLEVTRLVDLPARFLTGLPQHAHYSLGPLQRREIMGTQRELRRLDERVRMPDLGFRTTNHYWFDPATGRVLISEQQLAPGLPKLLLTELVDTPATGGRQ